ncbi:hypothetical protein M433DRAFT_137720 [Acidomyces richmondensis BFW]|nr:MAG: hypothetical protein FE78DRAFT_28111 [Acidomyces sp. 'richmondensis']KYG41846.1 hypothetical protein M433DRAFT_137720 [Acidomyces richmondensis BFW]
MAVGVFPLLDLPPELRIKVYEYIATSSKVKIRKAGDRKKTKWPAIVFVSRRLSNEALPVIYMNAKVEAVVEDMDFSNVVNFIRRSASFCFKALGQNKHLMAKFMRFDGHFTSLHNWLDYSFACSLYGAKAPNWKYKVSLSAAEWKYGLNYFPNRYDASSYYVRKAGLYDLQLLCKYEENEFKREICQKMLNAMDKCYIAMTRQGNSGP